MPIDDNKIVDGAGIRLSKLQFGFALQAQALLGTGEVLWVDENHPQAADVAWRGGGSDKRPFKTLAYALAQVRATTALQNKGTIIVLQALHAETIDDATSWLMDEAAVTILGLGWGRYRPTLTFGSSSTAASIKVTAANCRLINLRLVAGIDDLVRIIHLDDGCTDFIMANCELREGSALQFLVGVDIAHANCARIDLLANKIFSFTDGADSGIKIGAAADEIAILGNTIFGDFDDAPINNPAAAIATNLHVEGNKLLNRAAASSAIKITSECTGQIMGNWVNCPNAAAATLNAVDITGTADKINVGQNYGHDAGGDDSGLLNPAADS